MVNNPFHKVITHFLDCSADIAALHNISYQSSYLPAISNIEIAQISARIASRTFPPTISIFTRVNDSARNDSCHLRDVGARENFDKRQLLIIIDICMNGSFVASSMSSCSKHGPCKASVLSHMLTTISLYPEWQSSAWSTRFFNACFPYIDFLYCTHR